MVMYVSDSIYVKKAFLFIFVSSILALFLFAQGASAVEVLFTNPSPVRAGRSADITLQIRAPEGTETSRENIVYTIRETSSIRPVSGQEFFVARLDPGQVLTRTFTVFFSESIPTGIYPLELVETRGSSETRRRFEVFVEGRPDVPELRIGSVRSVPNRLIQDTNDNILNVEIRNLGEINAELVSASLVSSDEIEETFFGSLEDSVSNINGGQSEIFSFEFDIAETDEVSFDAYLDVTYRMRVDNNFEVVNLQLPFEIRLGRTPRFEIVDVEPLTNFRVGSRGNEMRVTVRNTGVNDGNNVRLRLFPNPSSPFDFDRTTIFVSALLLPGEETSFIVPFDILDTALLQTYNINIEFESVLGTNRFRQSDRMSIDVVSEASSGFGAYALVIIVIAVLLSLGIGFVYNRKKK